MTKLLPFCLVMGLVTAGGCAPEQGSAPESTDTDQTPAATEASAEPTVDEQIQTLDEMCADAGGVGRRRKAHRGASPRTSHSASHSASMSASVLVSVAATTTRSASAESSG